MSKKLTLKLLVLLLFLTQLVSAQEVYVGNRPFDGPTSERGSELKVGVRELAEALELDLQEQEGLLVVDGSEIPDGATTGVVVQGVVLELAPGAEGPMVNLKQFAEAAGLTYRSNSDLGTVDVLASKEKKAGAGGPIMTAAEGEPTVLNASSPGELLDAESYIQPGKLNFFLWYKKGQSDAGYRSAFSAVDVLAKYPNVNLVKINVGEDSTPLAQKYPGMVPRLIVLKNRRLVKQYNGHSLLRPLKDPEFFLDQMWKL